MGKSYANKPRHCCIALLFMVILVIFFFNVQIARLNQLLTGEQYSASIEFSLEAMDEENSEPLNKTTEEKNPSQGNTFSEEYLGDGHRNSHISLQDVLRHYSRNTKIHVFFQGELFTPPPEV